MQRNAIALMITLLFVITISAAIGIGLKQVKEASQSVNGETFMIESSVILDDVLRLLKTNKDLDLITKAETLEEKRDALALFLASSEFIPFESSGVKVILEIHSARAKLNINNLIDQNGTLNAKVEEALLIYFRDKGVEDEYLGYLKDGMGGIKEDGDYQTELFVKEPEVVKNYIVNKKHLEKINETYGKILHTNSLSKIKFDKLFCYEKDRNVSIDLNYAPKELWRLMLGVDDTRAQQLVDEEGMYAKEEDLLLKEHELKALKRFKVSFYEPFLDVKVEILKADKDVKIQFEYDLTKKKGSHFIYEL